MLCIYDPLFFLTFAIPRFFSGCFRRLIEFSLCRISCLRHCTSSLPLLPGGESPILSAHSFPGGESPILSAHFFPGGTSDKKHSFAFRVSRPPFRMHFPVGCQNKEIFARVQKARAYQFAGQAQTNIHEILFFFVAVHPARLLSVSRMRADEGGKRQRRRTRSAGNSGRDFC